MKSVLAKYGNLPVTAATLAQEFPGIRKSGQKLGLLERDGNIIRLKRGLYVISRMLTPSYVSMSSALRYYGLIPEAVYVTQSMTIKESRDYETPVGRFVYKRMSAETFHVGIRNIEEDGYSYLIASPEKALCDLIAETPSLLLRYRRDALTYLEEDIRFDMEAFYKLNPSVFEHYITAHGKKATSVLSILKLLN